MKKILSLALLALSAFSLQPSAFAQATTLVKPRQYVLFNGLLAPKQALSTNGTGVATNMLACWTNTLTPYSCSHPIGLSGIISTTNNMANASNLVVSCYRAFDILGGASIGTAYGTNFETTAFFTWTIPWTTNQITLTNIAPALWEPATSIGFTVNNQCNSNVNFTLTMSQAP